MPRAIKQLIEAHAVTEGAGVTVHRSLGTPALRNLDPFLMLDHFSSDDPDDYIAGFPDHPHRGFITFTYMLDGHMLHRDSMGNTGDLRAGGAQWMKAASGVIHSEMPQQTNGLMRGFQLWINLPAKEKMSAPAYREIPAASIPVIETSDVRVKVLCGIFQGVQGPLQDPHTQLGYFDIMLAAERKCVSSVPTNLQAFIYVFEGDIRINNGVVPRHHLAVLDNSDDQVVLQAAEMDARVILVAGKPLREPIVQQGPFVMNTAEEIQQAMRDYRDGKLVRDKVLFT